MGRIHHFGLDFDGMPASVAEGVSEVAVAGVSPLLINCFPLLTSTVALGEMNSVIHCPFFQLEVILWNAVFR